MTTKEVIKILSEKEVDFLKTKSFSKQPGIYAFFYIGDDFPLLGEAVSKHEIIYIGKTQSSQEDRDSKTHFTTGKTGSSTVRKSIGSILCAQENLTPIPRNDKDYKSGRFSHFKFDDASEAIITQWMVNNLALSFYEFPMSKIEIENLETELIRLLVPVLNISKNPSSKFRSTLQQYRKNCAAMARKNSGKVKQQNEPKKAFPISNTIAMTSTTGVIYIDNVTESDAKSKIIRIKTNNKHLFPAEQRGNPKVYSLTFMSGEETFKADYRIGSKDRKLRSGVLRLGEIAYDKILKIKDGTNLRICKISNDKYSIEII
jgi:hypothetical protein